MRSASVIATALWALVLCALASLTPAHAGRLSCGVCEAIVDEVNHSILTSTKTHSVQTRFRVDEKKRTPYARTEHHLLEIMEGEDFVKSFNKYGIVTPYTKTARHMKRAYELAAEGKEIEALVAEATPAPAVPAAETTPTPTPSEETAPISAEGEAAAEATPAAPAAPAVVEPEVYVPFRPTGSLPLSLSLNHVHLAKRSSVTSTGLRVASTSAIASEIKTAVRDFLEEYLDEAMLMFHRDVPDLKHKLCVETTESCVPTKRKPAKKPELKDEL